MIQKTYIQQLSYNGVEYTKGKVVDIESSFGCIATEFPLLTIEEPKDIATRDWADSDGRDIYISKSNPMKHYETEATFVFKGTEDIIRANVKSFLQFITGRNEGAVGGRLAVYDEYTRSGRKDVHVKAIKNEMYYNEMFDEEKSVSFKVDFYVEDPTTEVEPLVVDGAVTDLKF